MTWEGPLGPATVLNVSRALHEAHAKWPLDDLSHAAEQAAAEMLVEELTVRFPTMKFRCYHEAKEQVVESDCYNGGVAVTFAQGFVRGVVATWPRPYTGRGYLVAMPSAASSR